MRPGLLAFATTCVFSGAALYINIVEQRTFVVRWTMSVQGRAHSHFCVASCAIALSNTAIAFATATLEAAPRPWRRTIQAGSL